MQLHFKAKRKYSSLENIFTSTQLNHIHTSDKETIVLFIAEKCLVCKAYRVFIIILKIYFTYM